MTITKLASLNKLSNWSPVKQLEPVGKKAVIPEEICSNCNHSLVIGVQLNNLNQLVRRQSFQKKYARTVIIQ